MSPFAMAATPQYFHFEWSYDTTYPDLAGYRIYLNNNLVVEINDPTALSYDGQIDVEPGEQTFTMTAFDTAGKESPHSTAYAVEIPTTVPTNDPPLAIIQSNLASGDAPLAVNFDGSASTDSDGTIISYSWEFGDGEIGNGSQVAHTFYPAGVYDVTLVVTDDGAASSQAVLPITVTDPLQADNVPPTSHIISDATSGLAPLVVNFDGTSSSDSDGTIVSYSWNFGDGSTATGPTASHSYANGGLYSVMLIVTDDKGATATSTLDILVTESTGGENNLPTASFTANTTIGPAPLDVVFNASASDDSDGTVISYAWNFGDGSATTGILVEHSFLAAGVYTVTLTVTDDGGGTAEKSATITVTAPENHVPIASADNAETPEGTAVTIDVLANDSDVDGDTLTIASISQPANGMAATSAGKVIYTPNAGFSGTDSFTYEISDSKGGTGSATITVTVTSSTIEPGNTPPLGHDDIAATTSGISTTIDVLANDVDKDADPLIVTEVTQPANGTTTFTDNQIVYTPLVAFTGTDSFSYTMSDQKGGTATATVLVTVLSIDQTFTKRANFSWEYTGSETEVLGFRVYANTAFLCETTDPQARQLACDFTFSTEPITFAIKRVDLSGAESDVSNAITFDPALYLAATGLPIVENSSPSAQSISFVIDEGTSYSGQLVATDSDNDPLTFSLDSNPFEGEVTITDATTGAFTYTPSPGVTGNDSFTFKANDGQADSNIATVSVTINPVNDPPVAQDDTATTDEDTAVTLDVLANDTDIDGDSLTIASVTQPASGSALVSGKSIVYTPATQFIGTDSFSYTVSDGNGGTATATVTVTVLSVNDPPVVEGISVVTDEDKATTATLPGSDPDGDSLTFSIVTGPTQGTATITDTATGAFSYTPNPNANGTDSFTFKADDGALDSNTATVAITVSPVNDVPVAADDAASTDEDSAVTIDLLTNDSDVDGDLLTLVAVGSPANGTVGVSGSSAVYTPKANFNGTDTFTYTISDGQGGEATGSVAVIVSPVNDAPIADIQAHVIVPSTERLVHVEWEYTPDPKLAGFRLYNNGTLACELADPAARAMDCTVQVEADAMLLALTAYDTAGNESTPVKVKTDVVPIMVTSDTLEGAIPLTARFDANLSSDLDGSIATHTWDFGDGTTGKGAQVEHIYTDSGEYTVTLTVTDDVGAQSQSTAVVTATPGPNTPPSASDISLSIMEDSSGSGLLVASDPDNDSLTYTITVNGAKGTATITNPATGAFTYTPASDATGTDSFTFKANDGQADSNIATVSVTVNPVNDPPVAQDDTATTDEDTAVTLDVLANDTDADEDSLSIYSAEGMLHGSVEIQDNTIIYTPDPDFNGNDSFTYVAEDTHGGSNTGSVIVTVTSVNDPPVAHGTSAVTDEDKAISAFLPASDPDGDSLSFSIVTGPKQGTAIITNKATGAFTYTPNQDANGTDSFTFKVNDGAIDSNGAEVAVNISAVNDLPIAADDSVTTEEDSPITVDVLMNDSDIESSALSIVSVSQPSNGSAAITENGITYTPAKGFYGEDSLTYTIHDEDGAVAMANVRVTVTMKPSYLVNFTWEYRSSANLAGFRFYNNDEFLCETTDPTARHLECRVPKTSEVMSFDLTMTAVDKNGKESKPTSDFVTEVGK